MAIIKMYVPCMVPRGLRIVQRCSLLLPSQNYSLPKESKSLRPWIKDNVVSSRTDATKNKCAEPGYSSGLVHGYFVI